MLKADPTPELVQTTFVVSLKNTLNTIKILVLW